MGLQKYWKKRDFKITQEPRGQVEKSGGQLRFFIQKHDARRLHYDFRLELQGTLKSWAVPKGPSLDPSEKRLAVEVEDHPIAYGDFEGDIPAGQYGAGHVMLWDQGTWEAIGDPLQGYKKGTLKFRLHGHKLQGKWALVRMKPRGGKQGEKEAQPNWLLIKEQDEQARSGPEASITETSGQSVSALPLNSELVSPAGVDNESMSTEAAAMPAAYQPQLATLVSHAPEGDQWLSELKYDGYRALTRIEEGKVKMLTRNGHDWSAKWPVLAEALSNLPADTAWLDGEVVAMEADDSISFQALQNAIRLGNEAKLAYFVFDLLYLDGHDLTQLPLLQRKELLQTLLANQPSQGLLRFSDHIAGNAPEVFKHACLHGLEGIVVKHAEGKYLQRRSDEWLKIKCGLRQEFVVAGYTDPAGSRESFGALLLGVHDESGALRYAGRVGTGFNQDSLKLIAKEFPKLSSAKPAFANPPRGREALGVHWLKPVLVAEVKFAQWTSDGLVRHASFVGLRSDKPAEQVTHEIAKKHASTAKQSAKKAPQPQPAHHEAQVAGIRLSNPAKVLFAEDGLTKLDIARHYAAVEKWILPYLHNRPISIVRCPDGYNHHCFFQKHVTQGKHHHLQAVQLDSKGGQPEYFMANTLPAIVELVQLGVLELHSWGSRYPHTSLADRLIFDLDPAPGLPWERVTEAALLLRGLLEELELACFVKTTGGKGLHVEVPIKAEHPWELVKAFTQGIARHVESQIPERFTSSLSKKKREGRIFIDYLRNSAGATAVVPYSTRAKAGAPVATPLAWDEVGQQIHSDTFNINNISERFAQLKTDPWKGYLAHRQRLGAKALKLFT